MDRIETTEKLSKLAEKHIASRCKLWAPEVDVPCGRVDFMGFTPYGDMVDASSIERGRLTCYEVKSCMDDFMSGHGLNLIGDMNWIVCPKELCKELREGLRLPGHTGVLCPDRDYSKLIETVYQPSPAYRFHRSMSAAEAIWRIAKKSYGATYEEGQ